MAETRAFTDREDAGRQLAHALRNYSNRDDVIVLGLPRGGLPVAFEVALALHAPLDVFVVRKLGVPGHEEMAAGAIATGGVRVLNRDVVTSLNIDQSSLDRVEESERHELQRRESLYRDNRPMPDLSGKVVILVDDGLATGATMRAAVKALKQHYPAKIVVAVPTASRESCDEFHAMDEVDDVICLLTPREFRAVGMWYHRFDQTSDDEVRQLLREAREREDIPAA